jgi:hypothetical protein
MVELVDSLNDSYALTTEFAVQILSHAQWQVDDLEYMRLCIEWARTWRTENCGYLAQEVSLLRSVRNALGPTSFWFSNWAVNLPRTFV